jgi:hypothetical protein
MKSRTCSTMTTARLFGRRWAGFFLITKFGEATCGRLGRDFSGETPGQDMRSGDVKRLEVPFPLTDDRPPTEQFYDALELRVPNARALAAEILADLDTKRFGIAWWVGRIPTKRRILIGDQLYLATAAIEENLSEAKLHLLEAEDFFEQHARKPQVEVIEEGGAVRPRLRRLSSAADHLPGEMAKLHVVGLFRAVGSALDCLGIAIVGALALPASILKGDLGIARNRLSKLTGPKSAGKQMQQDFAAKLETLIDQHGPTGWLDWTLAYRNLFIHRGRHLHPWMVRPTGAGIWLDAKRRKHGVEPVLLLSREPARGEVDALRDLDMVHVLTEEAQVTLRGVFESTTGFVNAVCAELLSIWKRRRDDPELLTQPESQWPKVDLPPAGQFVGYAPKRVQYNPKGMFTSETFTHRLQAAGLHGDRKTRWGAFD